MSQIDPSSKKFLVGKLKNLSKMSSEMDSVYGRILLRDDPRLADNKRNLTVSINHTFKVLFDRVKKLDKDEGYAKSIKKYMDKLDKLLDLEEWDPKFTPVLAELYSLVYQLETEDKDSEE